MKLDNLARELNRYPAERVWECLDGIHLHPERGPESSMRAFTGPAKTAGVSVRRVGDLVLFRFSVIQQGAGFYDELEMSEAAAYGLGRALLARLREWGIRPANESAPAALVIMPAPAADTASAPGERRLRPLRKHPASQVRCGWCHEALEGDYEGYITGPDTAFVDGDLWCSNPDCPGKGGPSEPTIARGQEDDAAPPESGAFLAVDSDE